MSSARPKCALFMRGSQESIDQQYDLLSAFAEKQVMDIAAEFIGNSSATEDASSVFLALEAAIKDSSRPWGHLLMVDFSRISRSTSDCSMFLWFCEKAGVQVHFAKYPDLASAPVYSRNMLSAVFMNVEIYLSQSNKTID